MVVLDKIRWLLRAWRYRLIVEKDEISFLIKKLKQGQVAVDIGAHKGAYTYWMSKCVGENGKVFSFEPQPILYKKLSRLIEKSRLNNIFLYPIAFSKSKGKTNLIIPNGSPSPSASINRDMRLNDTKIEIKTTTLDDFFCSEKNINVDYLKCDVEGHELDVFENNIKFFNNCRPIISVESEARHCGEDKMLKLFSFFKEIGYNGYFFNRNNFTSIKYFSIYDYQLDPEKNIYINNFIFISG